MMMETSLLRLCTFLTTFLVGRTISSRNAMLTSVLYWLLFCWELDSFLSERTLMKRLLTWLVATAVVFTIGVSSASATSITVSGNTSFEVFWGSTSATFTISAWSPTSFNVAIAPIDNTLGTATLEAFGFGLDPNATGISNIIDSGSVFTVNPNLFANPNLPGFTVDICAYGGNNCSGGGTGLNVGSVDAVGVSLTVQHAFSSLVTFAPIPAKFQSGPGGGPTDTTGGECLGSNCAVDGLPLDPVPEPATWVLLGTGVALAFRMRRKKSA